MSRYTHVHVYTFVGSCLATRTLKTHNLKQGGLHVGFEFLVQI